MKPSNSKLTLWLALAFVARLCSGADALDSWADRSIPGVTSDFRAVTYGNSTFVGVGLGGTIVTSNDGAHWAAQTSQTSDNLYCLTFGNGIFVAAGSGDTVVTSPDGTNWTATAVSSWNLPITVLAFGNGKFVAAGSIVGQQGNSPGVHTYANVLASSTDGKNWTPDQSIQPTTPFAITAVAFVNGQWRLGGYTITTPPPEANFQTVFGASTDASNWSIGAVSLSIEPYTIAFGNGVYVGEGLSSATSGFYLGRFPMTFSSTDGSSWTYQFAPTSTVDTGVTPMQVKFLNDRFEIIGFGNSNGVQFASVATSTDGANWDQHYLPTNGYPRALGFGNDCYVVLGARGMIYQSGSILGGSTNGGALFQPLHLMAGGVVQGTLAGNPGTYAVQSSPDLATWSLLTNLTLSVPTGTFYDSISNSPNAKFYRATGP